MINIDLYKPKKNKNNFNNNINSVIKWPEHVVTLKFDNFNNFIEKYPLSMVDFWAPWCTPCRVIAPRVRRLSKIYKERIAFGKLNIQKNQDIAKKYKIMGIPYLAFFRYGKKISNISGVKNIGDLKNIIDNILKKMNDY
jgi:thioredoxin 1